MQKNGEEFQFSYIKKRKSWVDETTFDLVEDFILKDEISRNCPELRDYVIGDDENCIAKKRRRDEFEGAYTCYSKSNTLVSKLGFQSLLNSGHLNAF